MTLNISFPPSFRGDRLAFNPGKQNGVEPCFASSAGQTAEVSRRISSALLPLRNIQCDSGTVIRRRHFSLRERITKIDQHPDFPGRGNEERTAHAVKGIITDVQLFGYDEASLPNAQEREAAKKVWGVYRQEIYANDDERPFAIIQWRHSLRSITLAEVDAVPPALMVR